MIVTCPQCTARYKLDKNKISARGAKITCPRCRHVFVVYRDEDRDDVTNTPLDTVLPEQLSAQTPGRRDASTLDFRKVGISSWKVRVKIGLVYDFSDIKTLRKYIQDGRVTADDVISHDGATWVTIGDIPDLDAYFIEVYERCEAERDQDPTGPNEFEEDDDTNVIGMGSLGGKLAEQALAQATAEAEAELKAARSPKKPRRGSPPPAQVGPQFVDPFAALKDKQRERIQQRRRGGAPAPAAEATGSNPMVKVGLAVAVLAVLAGGAWWWSTQQSNAAIKDFNTTGAPIQPREVPPVDPVEDLNKDIDEGLETIGYQAPEEPDEPELRVVVPPDQRGVVRPIGPNGTQDNPPDNADHEADCLSAGGRGDWTGAIGSCAQAQATSGNANVGFYYGVALYKKGQGDRARGVLEGVAGVKCDAHLYLGRIKGGQGDIAGANGSYQAYKTCNPGDAGTADREMKALVGG